MQIHQQTTRALPFLDPGPLASDPLRAPRTLLSPQPRSLRLPLTDLAHGSDPSLSSAQGLRRALCSAPSAPSLTRSPAPPRARAGPTGQPDLSSPPPEPSLPGPQDHATAVAVIRFPRRSHDRNPRRDGITHARPRPSPGLYLAPRALPNPTTPHLGRHQAPSPPTPCSAAQSIGSAVTTPPRRAIAPANHRRGFTRVPGSSLRPPSSATTSEAAGFGPGTAAGRSTCHQNSMPPAWFATFLTPQHFHRVATL